jgi:hypothetical protein
MTEQEWITATDPTPMLEFLRGKASDRKLRLFGCAFFRQLYAPVDPRNTIIAVGEKYADGMADSEELKTARSLARRLEPPHTFGSVVSVVDSGSMYPCVRSGRARTHCERIRDIFGNPFRRVSIDSKWLTSKVAALATGIYQEKAFDRFPILADALQDAGAGENHDILTHLRSGGEHVRGCWALDLVVGKE